MSSGSPTTRLSPTTATSSSTDNAPATTVSPSADAARRITSAPRSSPDSTRIDGSSTNSRSTFASCSRPWRARSPSWGGPLAMPRDLAVASRRLRLGLASAGGYTGDGVVLSHVAATALADLITSPDHRERLHSPALCARIATRWEFEPLRWIGINAGLSSWPRGPTASNKARPRESRERVGSTASSTSATNARC